MSLYCNKLHHLRLATGNYSIRKDIRVKVLQQKATIIATWFGNSRLFCMKLFHYFLFSLTVFT